MNTDDKSIPCNQITLRNAARAHRFVGMVYTLDSVNRTFTVKREEAKE